MLRQLLFQFCGMISLNVVLIDPEIIQINKKAIQEYHQNVDV